MIEKISSVDKLGVYKSFKWDDNVRNKKGQLECFKKINIIYGRNYSGKTTLSRIARAMETGDISDKFGSPSFNVSLADGTTVTEETLRSHAKTIRVFNEDFVRENLRFITNPNDSIESFAILGEDNNKIEQEIKALEVELGSSEVGKETGLYGQCASVKLEYTGVLGEHTRIVGNLNKQLRDKATDRNNGIKYKPSAALWK